MNGVVSFTVRNLPKPLHAALKKIALANRHSLNDEVVIAIEGHVTGGKGLSFEQADLIIQHARCSSSICELSRAAECIRVDDSKRGLRTSRRKPMPKRTKGGSNA